MWFKWICFYPLAPAISDRVIAFLLQKLEANYEKTRIGSLAVIKHLVNSSGESNMLNSGVKRLFACLFFNFMLYWYTATLVWGVQVQHFEIIIQSCLTLVWWDTYFFLF